MLLRVVLLALYFNILIEPSTLEAEVVILFMCVCQEPSSLNVKPRCLWFSTKSRGMLSKYKLGRDMFLSEKNITSVLEGLNVTNHCFAHLDTFSKSEFNVLSM